MIKIFFIKTFHTFTFEFWHLVTDSLNMRNIERNEGWSTVDRKYSCLSYPWWSVSLPCQCTPVTVLNNSQLLQLVLESLLWLLLWFTIYNYQLNTVVYIVLKLLSSKIDHQIWRVRKFSVSCSSWFREVSCVSFLGKLNNHSELS